MRVLLHIILLVVAGNAFADTLIAARAIPGRTLISGSDLAVIERDTPGAFTAPADAIGMEARRTLYPGRPIRPGDLGPPALVERNQAVQLRYRAGGLTIETEGRVLDRAGIGDLVRVMNMSSRLIVSGRVLSSGEIEVGQ